MNGNQYQYDPARMFQEWIQKSGKAQAEFVKSFGALMRGPDFDPLRALGEISEGAALQQGRMAQNIGSMFNAGLVPGLPNWGAYKTSVGSNGRISIPEAERDALGLAEGDLVQVVVLPVSRKTSKKEVKK